MPESHSELSSNKQQFVTIQDDSRRNNYRTWNKWLSFSICGVFYFTRKNDRKIISLFFRYLNASLNLGPSFSSSNKTHSETHGTVIVFKHCTNASIKFILFFNIKYIKFVSIRT